MGQRITLAVVGAGAVLLAHCGRRGPTSYAGIVDCPVAAVASPVAGQIESVEVREGDPVRRGQLLARVDAREKRAALAQAEANLLRAQESLREAEQSAAAAAPTERGAQADVARQQAELANASAEFARTETLARAGAATPSQLDAARARLEQARAAVASLGASRQATRGRVSVARAGVQTARAAVAAAQAALDLARVQLEESEIRSPVDGMVAEQDLQAGEWAGPGTPVVEVEDHARQWVRIDVEETALRGLRLGSTARVRAVAYPDRWYGGHVIEIGAEGEFALNRDVKRGRPDVRTFRVRVGLDRPAEELRPGMTAEVVLPAESGGAGAGAGRPGLRAQGGGP